LGSSQRRQGEALPDLAFRVTQEQEGRNRKVAVRTHPESVEGISAKLPGRVDREGAFPSSQKPVHDEAKRVCRCLKAAGFTISRGAVRVGGTIFIVFEYPSVSSAQIKVAPEEAIRIDDSLSLEVEERQMEATNHQEIIALARNSLKKIGVKIEPLQIGSKFFFPLRERVELVESATQNALTTIATSARTAARFQHSADYRSISFDGQHYTNTSRQAQIIEILHIAFLSGTPDLSDSHILEALDSPSSRLRDSFKGSELWGTLIISNRRGTRRLNLPLK
jgi:hypothetical protein